MLMSQPPVMGSELKDIEFLQQLLAAFVQIKGLKGGSGFLTNDNPLSRQPFNSAGGLRDPMDYMDPMAEFIAGTGRT